MQPVTCLLREFSPGAYRAPDDKTFISSPSGEGNNRNGMLRASRVVHLQSERTSVGNGIPSKNATIAAIVIYSRQFGSFVDPGMENAQYSIPARLPGTQAVCARLCTAEDRGFLDRYCAADAGFAREHHRTGFRQPTHR